MARIAGVDLPREKRVEIALTYIFGIGRPTSAKLLADTGVSPDARVRDLTDAEVARLRQTHRALGQGRGHAPHRGGDEHQAIDGHRLLSWHSASPGSARARPAYPYQRSHQEGPPSGHRGQEESHEEVIHDQSNSDPGSGCKAWQEGGRGGGHRPHLGHLQQRPDHDHRHAWQHPGVGHRREGGLQGIEEVDAVRRHGRRRELRPRGDESRGAQGARPGAGTRAAAASRRSRRSRPPGSRSPPSRT